jgi:WD40 repeat protein
MAPFRRWKWVAFDGGVLGRICYDGDTMSPDSGKLAVITEKNGHHQTIIYGTEAQNAEAEKAAAAAAPLSRRLIVQTGHASPVSTMAVSGGGDLLATGDDQGVVWLWRAVTGRAIRKLDLSRQQKQPVIVKAMTFNPTRQELLILSNSGIFVWPLTDEPARLIQAEGWASWGEDAVILPDGNNFVTIDTDVEPLLVFNTIDGLQEPRFIKIVSEKNLDAPVKISSDGELAACSGEEGGVSLLNVSSGKMLHFLSGLRGELRSHAFGGDNTLLASATVSAILVSNTRTGKQVGLFQTELKNIQSVAVHPRKPVVIAAGGDGKLVVIDLDEQPSRVEHVPWKTEQSLAETRELIISPEGHTLFQRCAYDSFFVRALPFDSAGKSTLFRAHGVAGGRLRFGPEGKYLIAAMPGAFTLWNIEKGGIDRRMPSSQINIDQIDPLKLGVITTELGDDRQTINLWNPETGVRKISEMKTAGNHPDTGEFMIHVYDRIGFSPKANFLHFIGNQLQFVYAIKEDKILLRTAEKTPLGVFGAHAYSPDESCLILEAEGREIAAFDIRQGKALWRTRLEFDPDALFYTGDGRFVSASGMMGAISLLDAETGAVLKDATAALQSKASALVPVRYGHCANYLLALNWDGNSRLFDISERNFIHRIQTGETRQAHAIEGPDGKVYIADESGKIQIIQPGGADDERTFELGLEPAGLVLSPDQQYLAVLIADGSIVLADVETGKQAARLVEFLDDKWAAVAPDGRYDSNSPGDLPGVSWIISDDPLTPLPVEIFMQTYFEPRLLPRLLAGEAFPPVKDLSALNRVQPRVEIIAVAPSENDPMRVSVSVETAAGNPEASGCEGQTERPECGVFDLRLFRDGQLVGYV